ncbi:S-layer homology domain-containing protein [Rothia mucilaginosa]|jgi:periplasmic protease|uniref:S-layer homology domain-containing protein n=2 Tax=Rothia TaxID=32207 RepID=A0A930PEQ9_9MICC|nr:MULTISPECIES: S-layer homology domain-containing protein [Rothia]MBF1650597.1 S-layer homology domain-containing protein [Rothia dentocariosa]MBF1671558.1 S-layer homology domain-containing protein [Rothia mucilaginosa]MBS5102348.1 S-layer homology domain-containing protein [Rothia mucilaginosa]OFL53414.1 transcriptional initiation protein Tat [Rothia sp. HMSC062H08]OFN71766.1 transcriptional initiation protein Tat [Rothia sp. HMSC078H08]
MSTFSSRRALFKGAAALTVAGALGAHHAGEQSAQAATLDVMTTPLTFKITEASFDISGFNLSYEITGLQAVLDTGLYTPYIEAGYYTKEKGFTQFYFFALEPKKRIENDPYVRHHVISREVTGGPKADYGIRLSLRPRREQYTILRTIEVRPTINTEFAWAPFIVDIDMDGEYAPDIYRSCKAKVLLLDKERCFYPKRAVTRSDLMDAIYRGARSPKVKLPARSPFPDVSPKDERYSAYIWAYQNGLTSGWSDGKMHPEAVASRATMAAFFYRYFMLTPGRRPSWFRPTTPQDMKPGAPFYTESVWLHSSVNIDTSFHNKSKDFRPTKIATREELARVLSMLDMIDIPSSPYIDA